MNTEDSKPGTPVGAEAQNGEIEAARADVRKAEHKVEGDIEELEKDSENLERAETRLEEAERRELKVTLIWGGTGASKPAEVSVKDTAGEVFKRVYKEFNQTPTDQDTFEVNEKEFPRSRFPEPVKKLVHEFGPKLSFEVIPPTSGA